MNTIIYCRVSTEEQREHGASLDYQEQALRSYCATKNYTIIECYREDFSAKHHTLERPEMKKIYEYCKHHRGRVDLILFLRWDRFTRSAEFAFRFIRQFREMGVIVNSIENPIDFTSSDWSTLIGVYCGNAQAENSKISKRTREGIRGTLKKGKWSNKAPRGYKNVRTGKNECHIEINPETAPQVQQAFIEVAKGVESVNHIRHRLFPAIPESSFRDMLKNPFYIGKIVVPAMNNEPKEIVNGQHPPIIDEDIFNRVQDLLDSKKPQKAQLSKTSNPDLFLRKFLVCPTCGHAITGAKSKGNGGYYTYYHCSNDPKHMRVRADSANELFSRYLGGLKPNKAVMRLYEHILIDICGDDKRIRHGEMRALEEQLDVVDKRLRNLDDKFLDGDIDKTIYERMLERLSNERIELTERVALLKSGNRAKTEPKIVYAINLINNLYSMIKEAPLEVKIQLLGSMFPHKIEFDGKSYRTNNYNKVLDIIYQGCNELRGENDTKKGVDCSTPRFSTRTRARTGMGRPNGV